MCYLSLLASFLFAALLTSASPHAQSATSTGAPAAASAFEQIKGLTGEWHAPEGQDVMINIFRPIAFGSAVLHEEWKRGEQLTATVFYLVGSELRADHFCDFKNQLRYVVKPVPDGRSLIFELRDATNLDVEPRHFHSTTWRFVDGAHMTQDWHLTGGGKEPKSVHLAFTRQK